MEVYVNKIYGDTEILILHFVFVCVYKSVFRLCEKTEIIVVIFVNFVLFLGNVYFSLKHLKKIKMYILWDLSALLSSSCFLVNERYPILFFFPTDLRHLCPASPADG